ncbi:MAG: UDP-N-acetylmuramoyl-tripeptide--D-alanyl-D-alanine ligase [Bacteroidota bacterium]
MVQTIYQEYIKNFKVSTDSRKITGGEVFFALKGPNFNGNTMAQTALDKGAIAAVIDDPAYKNDDRFILVDDALSALQELAQYHRQQLSIPIIGLTGSNGKTTTKELINAVLATKYKVLATAGNLNNHIGVPLTLLSITSEYEIAIIEMGANHVGEIMKLCEIALPSHGFITNIGKAHLEGFGGIEGVIRGKSELYDHLIKNDGVVWINSQNHILSNMAKRFKEPYFYPAEGDYYHCKSLGSFPFLKLEAENNDLIQTQLIGEYNFENVAIALCIGKFFEVNPSEAHKALETYSPTNNRSQIIHKGSNTIILDAYNANPSSMSEAIENLRSMESRNKVVILGDMNELGEDSFKEHQMLGKQLEQSEINRIFLCGSQMAATKDVLPIAHHFEKKVDLIKALDNEKFDNTLFLIKASRSLKLENILDYL